MIGLLLAIIVNTSLISEKVTASQLRDACNGKDAELCKAMIVSGANALEDPKSGFKPICPPMPETFEAFRDAYLSYLAAHPTEANDSAVVVTLEAYEGAFGCAKS
jgi:hypothetical protein